MSETNASGGYLENLGLFMTYRCEVACRHCLVQAGPHRKETMLERDAADWMSQAARFRGGVVKAVNFTGGEPFFDLEALRRLVAMAVERGLVATAVTNGYWAASPAVATRILESLPGLLFLQISADEHHQEKIPFERVENAVAAAEAVGIVYRVVVCTEDLESPGYRRILDLLSRWVDARRIETVLTFPAGRAGRGGLLRIQRRTAAAPEGACSGADSPTIMPDGRVVSCIGPVITLRNPHPLVLGDLRERSLSDILDEAELNTVLHLIRLWGPSTLLELLQQGGLGERLPRHFLPASICDVCHHLFSDASLVQAISELAQDRDLIEVVALGRSRRLGEDGMARRFRQG